MPSIACSLVAVKHEFRGPQAARWRSTSGRRHPFTVLSYQVAGELAVRHGAQLTLRGGDFHVIPAGADHGVTSARDAETWSIGVPPNLLASDRHAELLAPIQRIAGGAMPRVTIPDDRRSFVRSLYAELASTRAASPVRNESLVILLLAELAEHAPRPMLAPRVLPGDLASRVVAYIAANALSPLSLAEVASAVRSNRTHVGDVVRRATGLSVGELITEVRLEDAKRRIEETDELIEVIAERVGYADATHFSRMFKRRFGCPPGAWRRRSQREP